MHRKRLTELWATVFISLLSLNPLFAVEDHAAKTTKRAQVVEKDGAILHLEAAIKCLDSAIEHSKKGDADLVGESVQSAVTHLEAAKTIY